MQVQWVAFVTGTKDKEFRKHDLQLEAEHEAFGAETEVKLIC